MTCCFSVLLYSALVPRLAIAYCHTANALDGVYWVFFPPFVSECVLQYWSKGQTMRRWFSFFDRFHAKVFFCLFLRCKHCDYEILWIRLDGLFDNRHTHTQTLKRHIPSDRHAHTTGTLPLTLELSVITTAHSSCLLCDTSLGKARYLPQEGRTLPFIITWGPCT